MCGLTDTMYLYTAPEDCNHTLSSVVPRIPNELCVLTPAPLCVLTPAPLCVPAPVLCVY